MPTRSSSLLTGLGFFMFSLFVLNLNPEGPSQQDRLVTVLSGACSLLCWLEVRVVHSHWSRYVEILCSHWWNFTMLKL